MRHLFWQRVVVSFQEVLSQGILEVFVLRMACFDGCVGGPRLGGISRRLCPARAEPPLAQDLTPLMWKSKSPVAIAVVDVLSDLSAVIFVIDAATTRTLSEAAQRGVGQNFGFHPTTQGGTL